MAQPVTVNILSDDDDDHCYDAVLTPVKPQSKRQRGEYFNSNPTVVLIDDDPTPLKPPAATTSTPSFVAETPMLNSVSIVKCTSRVPLPQFRVSPVPDFETSRAGELICLVSDNESERGSSSKIWEQKKTAFADVAKDLDFDTRIDDNIFPHGDAETVEMFENVSLNPILSDDNIAQVQNRSDEEVDMVQNMDKSKDKADKKRNVEAGKKGLSKEEKNQLMEEKKRQNEQEKLRKVALRAEAAEMKKLQKEKQKWEKGKFALKSIVAEIDAKVVDGSVGGHLLTRLSEKGILYRITSNPIERSIVWSMPVPEEISQLSSGGCEIPYVLVVYEAEEFCNLVLNNDSLTDHASRIQTRYPSHTICYLTNKLMSYINKREQSHYKDPASSWRRPPVEEVLSKLTTNFCRVHSRQCIDEAELAEHVVGLTCSLASCQFRMKLTRLSVNANGSLIPKDCFDKTIIKKSPWLKALLAIPKVQPRFALAIWKTYPTMKSLLTVYLDSAKTVHEKEFLLKDLPTEGLVGEERKLGEICSKRVYRILTAKHGSIKTDEVEDGADCFSP